MISNDFADANLLRILISLKGGPRKKSTDLHMHPTIAGLKHYNNFGKNIGRLLLNPFCTPGLQISGSLSDWRQLHCQYH